MGIATASVVDRAAGIALVACPVVAVAAFEPLVERESLLLALASSLAVAYEEDGVSLDTSNRALVSGIGGMNWNGYDGLA